MILQQASSHLHQLLPLYSKIQTSLTFWYQLIQDVLELAIKQVLLGRNIAQYSQEFYRTMQQLQHTRLIT